MPVSSTFRPSSTAARRWLPAVLGLLAVALGLLAPQASAASARRVVRYAGVRFSVPADWPVFDLARRPHTCVRFDRHAVYLGRPGAAQRCPVNAVGRTEAVLASPAAAAPASLTAKAMIAPLRAGAANADGGGVASVLRGRGQVRITATWRGDPTTIRSALGGRSPADAARASARGVDRGDQLAAPSAESRAATVPGTTFPSGAPTGAGSPGAVYTGYGFDACSAPSESTLSAWQASSFRAVGVYIGGANMACSQPNLTATWVSDESAAGWHLIPIYVGLQSPTSGCGCASISPAQAAAQGTAAAQDAVARAQSLGLGTGNPIYDDMENYARSSSSSGAVLAFLGAWTTQLHASGYLSGIYSSELSGIEDLVGQYGTTFAEPDDIWVANWNGQASTTDADVPSTDWAAHQRMHQYRGGHTDEFGGASIDIDSDYVDAATAAPGDGSVTTTIASAPSISVRPDPDGTLELTPSWSGQPGIARYRILAGDSSAALSSIAAVGSRAHLPLVLHSSYDDFQVQALSPAQAVLGSSVITPVSDHLAIYGNSSFVPARGPGGLPVKCFGIADCQVSAAVWLGRRRLSSTGPEHVAAGGGIVYFTLSPAGHRDVERATGHRLPVTVILRTSSGQKASRPINLIPFTVSGRGPRTRPGGSSQLQILGGADFVSDGWAGGVLAACLSATSCSTSTLITAAGGQVISEPAQQMLGAGEIGYLGFHMTPRGHRLLRATRSNQLGARVTVSSGEPVPPSAGLTTAAPPPAVKAQALISLSGF